MALNFYVAVQSANVLAFSAISAYADPMAYCMKGSKVVVFFDTERLAWVNRGGEVLVDSLRRLICRSSESWGGNYPNVYQEIDGDAMPSDIAKYFNMFKSEALDILG